MAKVYKATVYIVDMNEEIQDLDAFEYRIEDRLGKWVLIHSADLKESKEFEWEDELRINNVNATTDDYEKYFKGEK